MTNNDVLRSIRKTFEYDDAKMISIFAQAGHEVTRAQVCDWLKRDEDPAFQACGDKMLATFLNGFINEKRGKKEGEQPKPEKRLTNNIIFRKLKIALDLKADDIVTLMEGTKKRLSKHELSAFFRKPDHKNYNVCKDQVLRNFLKGVQMKHNPELTQPDDELPAETSAE